MPIFIVSTKINQTHRAQCSSPNSTLNVLIKGLKCWVLDPILYMLLVYGKSASRETKHRNGI